jgi:hypothetical protein
VGPGDHVGDLVLVDALERHSVDLDLDAFGARRLDPCQHHRQVAAPGDRPELVRVQRVERHVDPAHAEFG